MPPTTGDDSGWATGGAPLRTAFTGRRVSALALAVLGLLALVSAQLPPWISVRLASPVGVLFGQDPAETVRTYRLAELSGLRTPLYVGWVLLFGLFATAWVKSRWRRNLLRMVLALDVVLTFLTLDLGHTAARTSGYRPADYPVTQIRSGAFLALLGLILVTAAVAAVAVPARVRPRRLADRPPAMTPAPAPQPPVTSDGVGWSARPMWVPWWHRRGPLTALVIGMVATVVVFFAAVWLVLHRPPPPRDDSGNLRQLLITAPTDAIPLSDPAGTGGELSLDQVVQVSHPELSAVLSQVLGPGHAVVDGWTESDGTTVLVALVRFESADMALQSVVTCRSLVQMTPGDRVVAEVPGLAGAQSFVDQATDDNGRTSAQVMGRRGDIVFLITEARPGSVDLMHLTALARDQYGQL